MKIFYDHSIKNDIRRLFILTIITCLLTVGIIIFYHWKISVDEMILEVQVALSQSIQREIENFIAVPMQMNERNRYAFESGIIDRKSPEEMAKFFAGVMRGADDGIYSFSLGTEYGEYYGVRKNQKNQFEFMRSDAYTGGDSVYYELDNEDKIGNPSVFAGPFDVRKRIWYVLAKTERKPVFSPVYKHFVMQDLAISAASPLYAENGDYIGVLGTHSTLRKMNKELKDLLQDQKCVAYIIEKNTGELIANTEGQPNFVFDKDKMVDRINVENINNKGIRQGYEQYVKNGKLTFSEDGIYVNVSVFKKDGLEWLIITAVPEPQSVGAIKKSIIISILLSLILVFIEGYVWKNKVDHCLSPISDLVQITEKFSLGNFSSRASVIENNEVGKLAEAFNNMAEHLNALINNLEEQVKKRTQELEEKNTALLRIKAELENALEVDFLTGLYNRKFLIQKIDKEISLQQECGAPFAVIMVDVDYFKRINDSFGHDCGDMVLRNLANLMKATVGTKGYVGRWGGEEFLAFIPAVEEEEAVMIAENIRSKVNSTLFQCGKECVPVTLTLGVSIYRKELLLDDLVKKADIAVYFGKENGRNQVSLFTESMRLKD